MTGPEPDAPRQPYGMRSRWTAEFRTLLRHHSKVRLLRPEKRYIWVLTPALVTAMLNERERDT